MNKYEFYNEQKSIIRHNLVPELLIEVVKLEKPNNYDLGIKISFDDVFDEKLIKGHHFIFKIIESYNLDFNDIEDFSLIRSILKRAGKWYQAKVVLGEIKLEKFKTGHSVLEDKYCNLMKGENPDWWLVAHKESNIIIEFEQGDFNHTQKVSDLTPTSDYMQIARILREVGEWLITNHPKII